jgi:hypothetical protein
MSKSEYGLKDVKFTVGGIELDFENVVKRIEELFDWEIEEKAKEILSEKYDGLIEEIDEIKARIEKHETAFKYDWE